MCIFFILLGKYYNPDESHWSIWFKENVLSGNIKKILRNQNYIEIDKIY